MDTVTYMTLKILTTQSDMYLSRDQNVTKELIKTKTNRGTNSVLQTEVKHNTNVTFTSQLLMCLFLKGKKQFLIIIITLNMEMVTKFHKILSYISALHLQEETFARSQHHILPQACKTDMVPSTTKVSIHTYCSQQPNIK